MKVVQRFGPDEIRKRIPHRDRNFVVDRIEFFEDDQGVLKARSFLRVQPGEADGRDIFLQGPSSRRTYSEFVLVEHMALTSAVYIAPFLGDGKIAFFSTITNFEGRRLIPAGGEVEALIESAGRKGPFHRSVCRIVRGGTGDGEVRTDLMAAVVDPRATDRVEGERKTVPPPERSGGRPVDRSRYAFKDPRMVFLDEETALDPAAQTLTARYVYPKDHPFAAGHFPGNPIMMGVSQWSGVLDAAFWLARRIGRLPGTLEADGEILRADGTLVTEIKGLEFAVEDEAAGPRLLRTKRIGFRDMVRGGEEIFYRVRLRA